MLVEKNYKGYLDELSSNSPSPGGGSVSAISGGLAVSTMQMVCSVTIDKKGYEEYSDHFKNLYNKAQEFKDFFINAVDEDSEAFSLVIQAFRMPKATEEEKKARLTAIQQGYKHAAKVPFEIGKKAYEFLPLLEQTIDNGNKSAITDAYVSAVQLFAAIDGAFINVRINLSSIKDKEFVDKYNEEMDIMLIDANKRVTLIKEKINTMI